MGIKPIDKCKKGDIEISSFKPEILKFEILVERSSLNNGVRIRMWKKEDDKFQIERFDKSKQGEDRFEKLRRFTKYDPETEAWREYEKCCDDNGCSPYPEAKGYYARVVKVFLGLEEHSE